jgi:hypothetical protein
MFVCDNQERRSDGVSRSWRASRIVMYMLMHAWSIFGDISAGAFVTKHLHLKHLYAAQDDLVRRCHNISTVASGLFMAQLLLWCFRTDNFEASHIPFSQMYAVNKHRSHPKFFIMHTINFTRNEHWQCHGHNVSETCLWTTGRTWSLILQVIWLFLEQVHFVRNVSRQDLPSQASWEHWSWTGTTAKHCFSWLPGLMRHIL